MLQLFANNYHAGERKKERKKEKGKKDKLETTVDGSALASGARAEKDVTYEKYSLHGK